LSGLKESHWREFEKFLARVGCVFVREKGDHRIWTREKLPRPIVIPKSRTIPVFVIRNNLRLLGVSVAEYLKMQ
jgi:predicted RNA binding protein YcfA (HicA-like mRNA interferase family)